MTSPQQSFSSQPPPIRPHRPIGWRRPVLAATFGCATLIGVSSIAVVATESSTSDVKDSTGQASDVRLLSHRSSDADCRFEATLTSGNGSSEAEASFGPVDRSDRHRSVDISVGRVDDEVHVGAMVDHRVFLELRANASREHDLVELMKDALDQSSDWFDHDDDHDTVLEFGGDRCDLETLFDEDVWVEDFLRSDSMVQVTSDDGECRFSSLFAGDDKPDDFAFEDLDIGQFDFDLAISDGKFEISLDTGDGSLGLVCESSD